MRRSRLDLEMIGIGLMYVLFWAAALGVFVGLPLYCTVKARSADDELFRHTPCKARWGKGPIEITQGGITLGCAVTQDGSFKIANRLTDYPVTLCLGHRGDCMSGHPSPFPGNRLTIAPGRTQKVKFRMGSHYAATTPRNYPITVLPVQGLNFSNLDIVVRSESAPSGP